MSGLPARMQVGLPKTVSDLPYLYCWICAEEEKHNVFARPIQLNADPPSTSRFIHPCVCSLVAHEKCLLSWIRQCRRDNPDAPIACPQCKTKYQLVQPRSMMLNLLEKCNKYIRWFVPIGATASAIAGIWIAATAYGCIAVRLFLGKYGARRALAGPWPWHFWIDIPLIPVMLIASRLPVLANFSTWLPTLVALPVSSGQTPLRRTMMLYRYSSQIVLPPSPVMMTLALPWIRVFYIMFKRRLYGYVLGTKLRRQPRAILEELQREGVPRMIIVGEDNQGAELVDGAFGTLDTLDTYETLDDGSRVPLIGSGDQGVYLDELEYGTFDDVDMPRTIYVTYYSLAKLVVQALGFPFIASFAGSILGRFARYSQALRQILGIAPGIIPERGCESWINVLWPSVQSTHAVEQYLVDNGAAVYDDLDPIWFRNAIGGGLYIVIKDALVLLYRYLRKQRRGQLHIKDLPFSDGVARELMQNAEPRPAAR